MPYTAYFLLLSTCWAVEEERGSWLNEADFLTGGGPSEAENTPGATAQEEAVVQVRTGARGSRIQGTRPVPSIEVQLRPAYCF